MKRPEAVGMVAAAVLLAVALAVHGPSLRLSIALIEDPTYIENSEQLGQHLREEGPVAALRQAPSIRQRL